MRRVLARFRWEGSGSTPISTAANVAGRPIRTGSGAVVTVLHFDNQGQVVEHRDYDNHIDRREPPCSGR